MEILIPFSLDIEESNLNGNEKEILIKLSHKIQFNSSLRSRFRFSEKANIQY